MSLIGKRTEFKNALDTVVDVHGWSSRPPTPRFGDAWPIWGGGEREDAPRGLFYHSWDVGVILPQDQKTADDWIDSHLDALVDALWPVAVVEAVSPSNFGTDTNPIYGLLLTTRSE